MDHEDTIILKGMRFYGFHGYLQAERELGQWFEVDIILTTDLSAAGESDDIDQTLDYSKVYDGIKAVAEGPPVSLIEALAHRIVEVCLSFPQVQRAEVTVKKPQAPLGGPLDYCAVKLVRSREAAL